MQFIIDKLEYEETLLIVTGNTDIGTIKGIWRHIKEPIIGKIYHVELRIDRLEETILKGAYSPLVYLENEYVIFVGICEERDNQVYYIRFDTDWLDMLDIDVIASEKKKGDYISFSANWHDIGIYSYDL